MIRIALATCLAATLLAAVPPPADAGGMHQAPQLRKTMKRLCPTGRPMRRLRTGRSGFSGCP